ncbi:Nif3-like dinuclear metal center hexameric protein [Hydrogenovibrio sp. JE_KL2]|uniref:Nif3-like dinuclear metal center hexameric protein n=1 Tax=Hydrogenovibrio sp. JE_KL2 TaxID=2651188 RepID=UPI00128E7A09|nr:Nif3-like dinuclear metal center hexameric protein [Hydrogenovibrio sp. JE_KL2]MPQ76181.1 Nif3-like dinuclear metal center hexameric protein [Hydrogenovibrio sp. JE_KL2]
MDRKALLNYLDDYLKVLSFKDYAPNGLQVEGAEDIRRIVTGVTASQALIDKAIELEADTLLVHHGYFWKNEIPTITSMKKKRIDSLLRHNINLLGYHLPLDAHPVLGNNAQLAALWNIEDITPEPTSLVRLGMLSTPTEMEAFKSFVDQSLDRKSLHLPGGKPQVQKIAWCSGGAQNYIQQAIDWDADVYISGEVSEQTTHQALESGIHYLAAGHHATERLGVKMLGEHLQKHFALEVVFCDINNPV